jgi:hypothetical protein
VATGDVAEGERDGGLTHAVTPSGGDGGDAREDIADIAVGEEDREDVGGEGREESGRSVNLSATTAGVFRGRIERRRRRRGRR